MRAWLADLTEQSAYFMPHGHCYLWIPSLLWMHVVSDFLIGVAYVGISVILYVLVRRIRLPFSPIFIAFGLFIGLCGLTHFMGIWTVWNPDYLLDGLIKAATAAASVATAVGLFYVKPQVEEVVSTARLSEERRIRLESTHAELEALYRKVTEMDEMKSRFFANISHELRTPLALILGPAQRMQGDANLTEEQRRQLELIARNGSSLLKQVNDLLDVAKLEAGKMQAHYARLDLAPWFRRIASQFEGAAELRQIRYRILVPDTLPAQVDPDMLERVFINLLSNAFKFTPPQGEIEASLGRAQHDFTFTVSDTGPGISEEQRQIIFERFRQADSSAMRQYGGTGLGLAIVKDFVDLHGGQIDVSHAPGGGARFVVRLPLSAPAGVAVDEAPHALSEMTEVALQGALHELAAVQPLDGATAAQPAMPGLPSVLVVEDTRDMSDFIVATLRSDFNVVTAHDGQEGLMRAQALQPDLIVTDIMMPRMSGDQLVAALRDMREFDNVPILLLSAKADDALRLHLLQNGAQDYVTKPFLPRELLARAQNLVAMKQAGDILRREMASASGDVAALARELSVKHSQLQVALEAAGVARERAERAGQVKSHFLGLISHELRTPITTIHMSAELLAGQAQQFPEPLRPRLERLLRATEQMSTLVEGLLEYTRVESGRIDAHLQAVDSAAIAQDVIAAHVEHAAPGVRLRLDPPAELAPLISDPRLLRVVLSNLVSNALKFTRQGAVTMRIADTDAGHVFEVEDTGIGIAQGDLRRIFVPFEQLEPVQRKSIPGVGLGLALVKQIVEILGGKIEVTSQVDAGTTFRLCLPRRPVRHDPPDGAP